MEQNQKPCLIQTGRGFTVLYKERFLYSKYSPQKNILNAVENLKILPDTLIVCFSPCLWYGLSELTEKLLKEKITGCKIIAIENDRELFKLSESELKKIKSENPSINAELFSGEEMQSVCRAAGIQKGLFRRAVFIPMSAGDFFNREFYEKSRILIQEEISAFWKNRLTLVKFGRLYSRNFFKNLKSSAEMKTIPAHDRNFSKPFLIIGAGKSAELILKEFPKPNLKKFFVVAVDAVLPSLLKCGIEPDFLVAMESQIHTEKAYIGTKKAQKNTILLADLSSRAQITARFKEVWYFMSEFTDSVFIKMAEKEKILPVTIPPLGSVGLAAVYISLLMRESENIPVFTAGLDFSFTEDATHCRGTPAHTKRLLRTNRFLPVENYTAAFNENSIKISSPDGKKTLFTEKNLLNYAELFMNFFCTEKNLFNLSSEGINLGIPVLDFCEFKLFSEKLTEKECIFNPPVCSLYSEREKYILNEKNALLRIRNLLTNGNDALPPPSPSLNEELRLLLEKREYLYLHFPDGYKFDPENRSFLNRVRSELDFFIKDFQTETALP